MYYKLYYFLFTTISCIFIYLLPIYYVNSGFNEAQIGVLGALFSFAAITQPILGMIAEGKVGVKRTLFVSLTLIAMSTFLLYFTSSFIPVFALVMIYATFITPAASFTDNIIAEYTAKYKKNYGNYRIFFTLGWGLGVIFSIPVMYLFGFNSFLIMVSILTIISILALRKLEIPKLEKKHEENIVANIKILCMNKHFILLLLFSSIFYGVYRIRAFYQPLLMGSVSDQPIYLALLAIVMMVPELLILPHYVKIEEKFSFKQRMVFSIIVASLIMIIFFFSTRPITILLGASLHGVITAIYLPSILFETRRVVDKKIIFTALLISSTILSLISSLVALVIITPIFVNYGINYVFLGVLGCMLVSIIPLLLMKSE